VDAVSNSYTCMNPDNLTSIPYSSIVPFMVVMSSNPLYQQKKSRPR
jgi:hypothetical protein